VLLTAGSASIMGALTAGSANITGNVTILDSNLILDHSNTSSNYNPYILLNSNQANAQHGGFSTLYLTEQFFGEDSIQGAYIQYDGSDNKLIIGTQSSNSASTSPIVPAIEIVRGSTDVIFKGGITVNNNASISGALIAGSANISGALTGQTITAINCHSST